MILEENKARIRHLLDFCLESYNRSDLERMLRYASLLGSSAWFAHAGFYAHPPMERLLSQAAAKLKVPNRRSPWALPGAAGDGRRWLHVLSTAYPTGGHTRLAERWMLGALPGERHSCVLLHQEGLPCPDWLVRAAVSTGGAFHIFPPGVPYLDKAAWLRQMAYEGADVVVLHAHPDDPVPSVAFGIPGGPPVWIVNHAAHTFWYGPNIADTIIDFREPEAAFSYRRRYAKRVDTLPMPLKPRPLSADKAEFKRRLGIPAHWTTLVTIASSYKFVPFGGYHFPATVGDVVARHSDCALLVVGVYPDDPHWQEAVAATGGRIRLCGLQADVEPYYGAADVFLESFPFGSITAAMDAAMLGIPVMLALEPLDPILGLSRYPGMMPRPVSIEQYREQLASFIRQPVWRHEYGRTVMASVAGRHSDASWKEQLRQLIAHRPKAHAVGIGDSPMADAETELDRYWAQMQRFDGTFGILVRKFEQFNREFGGSGS